MIDFEQFWAWVSTQVDSSPIRVGVALAVVVVVIWALRPPPEPRVCGTCGVDARRQHHQPWCRRGRWGGSQKWRDDL